MSVCGTSLLLPSDVSLNYVPNLTSETPPFERRFCSLETPVLWFSFHLEEEKEEEREEEEEEEKSLTRKT